jgi:hypothetical protein
MIILVLEAECEECAAMIACLVKLFLPLWRCKRVTSFIKITKTTLETNDPEVIIKKC